jgi:hypothetical protein
MTDRRDYFDLVRQLVKGDGDGYRQRAHDLDDKGWDGLGEAVGAAFYQAVQRRFEGGTTRSEIIHFVADTRGDIENTRFDPDAKTAEALVRAAITGETEEIESIEPRVVVETEMILLWKLLGSLSDSELDAFFASADELAEEWSRDE